MNIKDLIMPLSIAMLVTWGVQYFFFKTPVNGQEDQVVSGQSFVAPQTKQEARPLNREVDFVDTRRPAPATITTVHTDAATLVFSSDGASLDRITLNRRVNGRPQSLTTVFPVNDTQREDRCFLVGLDQKTPYFYQLVDRTSNDEAAVLTYRGAFGDGVVEKKYTVHKSAHQIDLTVTVIPKAGIERAIEPRVFFVSPFMPDIAKTDRFSSLVGDGKGAITKTTFSSLDMTKGWYAPTIFGAESRYFVHALIGDEQHFVQRAYYRKIDESRAISILEGPSTQEQGEWTLSFYFGPKVAEAFAAVDSRLDQTLEYSGILAPISKLFLYLLKLFYKYLGNYGWAIVLLTFLLNLLLFPLARITQKSMKKQEEVSKKLKYVEQRYKNDPETLNREKAEIIRKHGMPFLTGGCLPMLARLPMFFALRNVLMSSIELYQAPFILWIQDLSAPDPYCVLPALIGGSMLLNAAVADKSQRMSLVVMAFVIGALMINFSAGLSLYIFMSTLLGGLQTLLQKKAKVVGRYVG